MLISEHIDSYDKVVQALIDEREREAAHNWSVGDLVLFGVQAIGTPKALRTIAGDTGLQYLTLAQMARVAKAFSEHERELFDLPWASYRAVSSLENHQEAIAWLEKASDLGWNTAKLIRELKGLGDPDTCVCNICDKKHVRGLIPDDLEDGTRHAHPTVQTALAGV